MLLASKQTAFLRMRVDLVEHQGIPPSVREIQMAGRFASTRSVVQYLDALEAGGFIVRGPGARNLPIVRRAEDDSADSGEPVPVPVAGTAAPRPPFLAQQHIAAQPPVPTDL